MRYLPVLFLAAGCAIGPGEPFATVEPHFEARFEIPADRRLSGSTWSKLASDYEVRLTAFELGITDVELRSRTGGGGGATFDPANPPAGYSLCHGGHCHRDDGALVSYEDIQAELSGGGGATVRTELALRIRQMLDLLAGASLVPTCEPDCTLGQTQITSVRAGIDAIRIEGFVRDGRQQKRLQGEVPFVFSGKPGDGLSAVVDIVADRTTPPLVDLRIGAILGPRMFDALDWAALVQSGGVIDVDVLEEFSTQPLRVEVTRSSPR